MALLLTELLGWHPLGTRPKTEKTRISGGLVDSTGCGPSTPHSRDPVARAGGNPKAEMRRPKEIRIPKSEEEWSCKVGVRSVRRRIRNSDQRPRPTYEKRDANDSIAFPDSTRCGPPPAPQPRSAETSSRRFLRFLMCIG